ncbi:S-layer homology domain-containing protein [Arthrobacter alpinus]|uniref:S-layer homology domain-containing protein n=2 Tax=Arthrobacter alpinus TaxID=656366 RepID=A0A1H5KG93_9MICC|nr:S-layer homology domain-containing protein [Arthrobacter alpinus]
MAAMVLSGVVPASPATAAAGTGSISGTVSAAPGVDVSKAYIVAFPDDGALATHSVAVRPDGKYTLDNLTPANYNVRVNGHISGGYDAWYGGVTQATAKPVAVGAGQAISGINVNVSLGATVSGTVTVPEGVSNANVGVHAWPDDPRLGAGTIMYGFSDSAGRYTLAGLPPGTYTVCFSAGDDGALTSLCGTWNSENGVRISVGPAEVITGIDYSMRRSSTISGTLNLPEGSTTAGLTVSARDETYFYPRGRSRISPDGSFRITGLSPGQYLVKVTAEVSQSDLVDQWYGAATSPASSVTVIVPPEGTTPGIDFTLVQAPLFSDVPAVSQFTEDITWLAARGVTAGYPDGTFRPLEPIHRDAMAAFLYRAAGMPAFTPPAKSPFRDVSTTAPFYKEITWLSSKGITTGYADGTFRPLGSVNRDAMAAFLYRMTDSPSCNRFPHEMRWFKDNPATAQFYDEIVWMACNDVSTGWEDGSYRPDEPVHRDAMAAFLKRWSSRPGYEKLR